MHLDSLTRKPFDWYHLSFRPSLDIPSLQLDLLWIHSKYTEMSSSMHSPRIMLAIASRSSFLEDPLTRDIRAAMLSMKKTPKPP